MTHRRLRSLRPVPLCRALTLLVWALGLLTFHSSAQPKADLRRPAELDLAQAQREGQVVAADLLAQKPAENATNTGTLFIRQPGQETRQVPVTFAVMVTGTNWLNTYAAAGPDQNTVAKLTVVHGDSEPNRYLLQDGADPGPAGAGLRTIRGDQAAIPFAGSDFWVCDLGLEFFHWPKQVLLRKELKRGQSCNVLESVNPNQTQGGYSRVVCWLDTDSGGIVYAEAFGLQDRKLKEFEPKGFKKVRGEWQLEGMQIRNLQTGSRTRIEFHLDESK